MYEAGCLGPNFEIIIEKMQLAFQTGALDINQLSASLGRE
jgi:hypothetical protein